MVTTTITAGTAQTGNLANPAPAIGLLIPTNYAEYYKTQMHSTLELQTRMDLSSA